MIAAMPGIAEDDLVQALGGRVSVVGRLGVSAENPAQLGNLLRNRTRFPEPWPRSRFQILGPAIMPQCPGDLLRQAVVQAVDQVADVIATLPMCRFCRRP